LDVDGAQPDQEISFLRRRVADLEALHFIPGRSVLPVGDDVLEGYLTLEREERRYTTWAMARHAEFVTVWYRLLSLLKAAVVNAGDLPPSADDSNRMQLGMQWIAAAGGTVKLILDAALAGYYAQGYMLTRHLLETWLRLEYIALRPEMAAMWFVGPSGEMPRPPSENTIHNYVKSNTTGMHRKLVTMVLNTLRNLNKMSHPSEFTLQQTVGVKKQTFNVGANYDPELCAGLLNEGANGLRLLLFAFRDLVPQPLDWCDGLRSVSEEYARVWTQEVESLERRRKSVAGSVHWSGLVHLSDFEE